MGTLDRITAERDKLLAENERLREALLKCERDADKAVDWLERIRKHVWRTVSDGPERGTSYPVTAAEAGDDRGA